MRFTFTFACLLAFATDAQAQRITGTVTSDGAPVADVNVFIMETLEGTLTDSAGRFTIATTARGEVTLHARRIGYRPQTRRIEASAATPLTIELTREPTILAPVTAVASRFAAGEERGASLTTLDVVATPGTMADVARALQTLPGAQGVDEGTALFVRGGDHAETSVLVDGAVLHTPFSHESPNGTFIGTVDPFLLDGIVFSAGGFGARYGNALSGIAALRTLGRPARTEATFGAGLAALSASVAVAGPHDLGLRIAANQTDTKLLFRVNGSTLRYDPAPRGHDRSLGLTWNHGPAGELKLFAIDQRTRLGAGVDEASHSGTFDMALDGDLAVLNWKNEVGSLSPSARISRRSNARVQDYGAFRMLDDNTTIAGAASVDAAVSDLLTVRAGVEWERLDSRLDGSVPENAYDKAPGARTTVVGARARSARTGTFIEADVIALRRARLIAGVRQDRSTLTGDVTIDPRISIAATVVPGVVLTGAWGIYHQVPDPIFLDPGLGVPTLPAMRATHTIAGVQLGSEGAMLRVEVYDKRYTHLAQMTRDYDVVGAGEGRARGADVFATGTGLPGLRWRVSLSTVQSRRTDPHAGTMAAAPFDIPRTVNAVVQQVLPGGLHLAMSWRHATGKPFTPVQSATFDPAQEVWVPVYGSPMSERLPDFGRIDLGLTHLRRVAGLQAVFYSGVTNLLDRTNVFAYRYTADYATRIAVRSLFNRGIYAGMSLTTP